MYYFIAFGLILAAAWLGIWFSSNLRMRRLSTAELEALVFHLPDEYFSFIGLELPAVQEYLELVGSRDLQKLNQRWPQLQRAFHSAEIAAGHSGRPLITDYFLDHHAAIRELLLRELKS